MRRRRRRLAAAFAWKGAKRGIDSRMHRVSNWVAHAGRIRSTSSLPMAIAKSIYRMIMRV